jgi:hypothetical protein
MLRDVDKRKSSISQATRARESEQLNELKDIARIGNKL